MEAEVSVQLLDTFTDMHDFLYFVQFLVIQGDHLSGKPGNVREFETCQGNVMDVVNSQGNAREKILSWKSVPKLFITRLAFPSKTVHSYIYT